MLPDDDHSKVTTCVDNAFQIWEETKEQKSAQLIFCDLSTPKGDGTFNVYEDIREKLIAKGGKALIKLTRHLKSWLRYLANWNQIKIRIWVQRYP